MNAIGTSPIRFAQQQLIQIHDRNFSRRTDAQRRCAIFLNLFFQTADRVEIGFHMAREVWLGINRRHGAEDNFRAGLLTAFDNRGDVLFIFIERNMLLWRINAAIVRSEKQDDDIGLVREDVLLQTRQTFAGRVPIHTGRTEARPEFMVSSRDRICQRIDDGP